MRAGKQHRSLTDVPGSPAPFPALTLGGFPRHWIERDAITSCYSKAEGVLKSKLLSKEKLMT